MIHEASVSLHLMVCGQESMQIKKNLEQQQALLKFKPLLIVAGAYSLLRITNQAEIVKNWH